MAGASTFFSPLSHGLFGSLPLSALESQAYRDGSKCAASMNYLSNVSHNLLVPPLVTSPLRTQVAGAIPPTKHSFHQCSIMISNIQRARLIQLFTQFRLLMIQSPR